MEGLIPLHVYWLRAPMLNNQIVYAGCSKNPERRRKAEEKIFNMVLTVTKSKPYFDSAEAGKRETEEIQKHWLTLFNRNTRSNISDHHTKACDKQSAARKGVPASTARLAALKATMRTPESKALRSAVQKVAQSLPEVREKKRMALLGRKNEPHSEATRKKIGDGNRGKVRTPKTRGLISAARMGKSNGPHSEETKRKIGLGNKGKTVSQETRELIRAIRTGTHQSAETVAKRVATRKANKENKALLQSGYGHPWRIKDLDKATQEAVG